MKLIFYDRQAVPVQPASDALLTIERKGSITFGIAAVAALQLQPTGQVVLAQDAETNTWYLVTTPTAGMEAFVLHKRDKSSKALMFCSSRTAQAYYQAHELTEERSVRSLVSATAIQHDGLTLYPLTPQHSTTTPPVAEATPEVSYQRPGPVKPRDFVAAVAAEPVTITPTASTESAAAPDVTPLPTDLPQLQAEQPAALPMVASTPASASVGDTSEGLSRAEQLADDWNERDLSKADDDELANLVKVLGNVPSRQRGFTEEKVLNAAKKELQGRKVKGGRRG